MPVAVLGFPSEKKIELHILQHELDKPNSIHALMTVHWPLSVVSTIASEKFVRNGQGRSMSLIIEIFDIFIGHF